VRTPRGDRIRRTGRLGGATLLVLAPWVAWTLAANGTIVQVSGVAGAWQYQHAYLAAHGDNLLTRISHGAWFTKLMFRGVLAHQYAVVPGHSGWPLAAGALAIGALMLAAPRPDGHGNARMLLLMLAVPIAGFLLGVVYHAGIRWHLRSWYLSPASVFLAILLGVGIDYLAKCARGLARRIDATARVRLVAVLPAALYVVAGAWLWRTYQPNHDERFVLPFQFQLNVLAGARWIEGHTPPNARVGAYNAGVIGYFSHRDVVNLDGVVNADALSALQDCRSGDYIREMRIAYLADLQDWLTPAKCGDNVPTYTTLATLGRRQTYFGGALVDIWQVSTGPP
jgi:hypothetical protein